MDKNLPQHIGFIMDGNRRWAKSQGLPSVAGHQKGYAAMRNVANWCFERGIPNVTFWAFSTENWNRSKYEVSYLMRLMKRALTDELTDFEKKNIRLKISGRLQGLPEGLRETLLNAMEKTRKNTAGIINIAFNYGGREEIVDAVKRLVRNHVKPEDISADVLSQQMYGAGMPDPDFIIRTSGEVRHSGFLLWGSAYSEYYFCPKMWPAFSEGDLDAAITEYQKRHRRFGGNG